MVVWGLAPRFLDVIHAFPPSAGSNRVAPTRKRVAQHRRSPALPGRSHLRLADSRLSGKGGRMRTSSTADTGGLALGVGAYTLWGVLPLYIHLLKGVPALQVL